MPPGQLDIEPNQTNVRSWLDNLYTRFQPIEQARWHQSNLDTLFHAGAQNYVNRYYSPGGQNSAQSEFYFNIIQNSVRFPCGYQRQHRKSINYIPAEGADSHTTDQYTRIVDHTCNTEELNEVFSKACELSCITGMVLLQPYLDYNSSDPAQGALKLKLWEYNSFIIDPFWRDDINNASFVWTQEFVSKQEALVRFPDKENIIALMSGTPQQHSKFYFLPENYNVNRNDLLVLSYVWFKKNKKIKKFYSKHLNQFFSYSKKQANEDEILRHIQDLEIVEIEVPVWQLATVLNDQLLYVGDNPLGLEEECPFVAVYWDYSPEINYYDLRVRSMVYPLRSPQALFNRRVILNQDISESSINTGYMRKVGAVANEDNLKKTGQGHDILINEGYEMTDVQKIIPNAVPPSNMALSEQMMDLIYAVSGVNLENWSGQDDKQISMITMLLKQGASLTVFQKYFDQWDRSLKQVGNLLLLIILNNWNEYKVGMLLGEEPSPHFFSKIFAKYKVVVAEGLNTATQKQQEFMQWMELNQALGGIIPPSEIAKRAVIQGKDELVQLLAQQEQSAAAQAAHQQNVQSVLEEAKVKELYSKAVLNISSAKERQGRVDSNLGLYSERLAMINRNNSMSLKAKAEALEKLVEVTNKYGELEANLKLNDLETIQAEDEYKEEVARDEIRMQSLSNDFITQMLAGAMVRQGGQENQM